MGDGSPGPPGDPPISSLPQNADPTPDLPPKQPNLYSANDRAPFTVFVQSTQTSPISSDNDQVNKNISKLHPIAFGKLLSENQVEGVLKITKKGRDRLGVDFYNYKQANNFVLNQKIKNTFETFIPSHLISCQGIVRSVHQSLSDNDIISSINSIYKVISVRRLSRRSSPAGVQPVIYEPTQTLVITFAGTTLPKYVKLYYCSLPVEAYILPVLRCYNCLRFGHTSKLCKSTQRCATCSGPHDKSKCEVQSPLCVHCSQPHSSLDANCPELRRQQAIKRFMATEKLTFFEASNQVPRINNGDSHTNLAQYSSPNPLAMPQLFPSISPICPITSILQSPRTSYAVSAQPKKRKQTQSPHPAYDISAHNSLLLSPNGHSPSTSSRPVYLSVPADNSLPAGTTITPPFTINETDLNTLKSLIQPLPENETIMHLFYSILTQALTNTSPPNQNGTSNTTMEY